MIRPAVLVAATLLLATTLGLAGCGSSRGAGALSPHVATLCVDASVPLTGPHAAVGRGLVAGIRMQLPVGGLKIGAYRVALCGLWNDAPTRRRSATQAALANATLAAGALDTIAEIGELTGADAQTAEAVLAPAGIPLLTPSGPIPSTSATPVLASAPAQLHETALYLLPSAATEADAVSRVEHWNDCTERRHGVNLCTVYGPVGRHVEPLCTGLPETTSFMPRFCVMGGPNLALPSWPSPAEAYGDAAAKLLISDLRQVARAGRDIADRSTVLSTLRRSRLSASQSPIGAARFDSQGAMEADEFTAYSVAPDGGLSLTRTFRTH